MRHGLQGPISKSSPQAKDAVGKATSPREVNEVFQSSLNAFKASCESALKDCEGGIPEEVMRSGCIAHHCRLNIRAPEVKLEKHAFAECVMQTAGI